MKQKLILAGTYQEFLDYIESQRLTEIAHGETHYSYGNSVEDILGKEFNEMEIVGTFRRKKDAEKIERYGKSCIREIVTKGEVK